MSGSGASCTQDKSCASGKCGAVRRQDVKVGEGFQFNYECCTGDMKTRYFTDYCVQPGGTPCDHDVQCTSNSCDNNRCVDTLDTGKPCSRDNECTSNACGRAGPKNELTCCAYDNTTIFVKDYCVGHEGDTCYNSYQCDSELCRTGKCIALNNGEECGDDKQCRSKLCITKVFNKYDDKTKHCAPPL